MSVIDDRLSQLPAAEREALERIRSIALHLVPDAEETISYGLPALKYKKQPLIYFDAFKDHLSLFPTSGPTEELKDKLKDFKASKGTIQFTLEKPLPEALIREIIEVRLNDINTR